MEVETKKTKNKKWFYIVGIIIALIVLVIILFFMFGESLLKINADNNLETMIVNFKDENIGKVIYFIYDKKNFHLWSY